VAKTKISGSQIKPTKLLEFKEVGATPSNPASGFRAVYATTAQKIFTIGSDGLVRLLSTSEFLISFGFSNGTNVLATGIQEGACFYTPYQMLITGWTLGSNDGISGSIVIDIWVDSHANFPPTVADSITASAKPNITSSTKGQSSTLTGWTTTIPADRWVYFNIDSVTSLKKVNGTLMCQRI